MAAEANLGGGGSSGWARAGVKAGQSISWGHKDAFFLLAEQAVTLQPAVQTRWTGVKGLR